MCAELGADKLFAHGFSPCKVLAIVYHERRREMNSATKKTHLMPHLTSERPYAIMPAYPPQGGWVAKKETGMDDTTKQAVARRLASAGGHIKGIERMVQDDAYCIDVIRQIQAVQAALSKISTMVLDSHLRTCVTTAIQGDDADEREAMLQEITSVFDMSRKL